MTNASLPTTTSSTQLIDKPLQDKGASNEAIDIQNRERIALGVLIFSIVAVLAISITAISTAKDESNRETISTRVMDSTLPLYGTWVGTILAFYFSRNAFEAASNSAIRVQQLTGGQISVPPPEDPLAKIALKSLSNGLVFSQNDLGKSLQSVVDELEAKERYRTVVVNDKKQYYDLVYRTNAVAYLKTPPGVAPPSSTLGQYLKWRNEQGQNARPTVVFLPESATLADADAKIKATMGCRDIIVTTDGKETSTVVVYVTDYDIEQYR